MLVANFVLFMNNSDIPCVLVLFSEEGYKFRNNVINVLLPVAIAVGSLQHRE